MWSETIPSGSPVMVNRPRSSPIVPRAVPAMVTCARGSGSPSTADTTEPVMYPLESVRTCARVEAGASTTPTSAKTNGIQPGRTTRAPPDLRCAARIARGSDMRWDAIRCGRSGSAARRSLVHVAQQDLGVDVACILDPCVGDAEVGRRDEEGIDLIPA